MAGVTNDGFTSKSFTEILSGINEKQKARISATWDPDPDQPTGQINAINAEGEALLWEILQVLALSTDLDSASGVFLDYLGKLVGLPRRGQTTAKVIADLNLDSNVTIENGAFLLQNITNNAEQWTPVSDFTSTVAGVYSVEFEATVPGAGPAVGVNGLEIATPISGVNSVSNPAPSIQGFDVQTDLEYRESIDALDGAARGSSTIDSLIAAVQAVPDVESATVLENDTNLTDANGLPPHSYQVLILDNNTAEDQDIIDAIFQNSPGGIESVGSFSGESVAVNGQLFTRKFERVSTLSFDVSFDAYYSELVYSDPVDVENAISEVLGDFSPPPGQDVTKAQIASLVMCDVPGILDCTDVIFNGNASTPRVVVTPSQVAAVGTVSASVSPWVEQ